LLGIGDERAVVALVGDAVAVAVVAAVAEAVAGYTR